jgi:hypothetical protein
LCGPFCFARFPRVFEPNRFDNSSRSARDLNWTPAQPSFSRAGGPKRLDLALRMNRPRIGRRPIHNPLGTPYKHKGHPCDGLLVMPENQKSPLVWVGFFILCWTTSARRLART